MIRIIMHGCNGKMGQVISELVQNRQDCEIVAGIDYLNPVSNKGYPVFKTLSECANEADVLIDFSIASALDELLAGLLERGLPGVICTTGFDQDGVDAIHTAALKIPLLYSRNMSLGINLLIELIQKAALQLSDAGFDIEIIEKHHNQKIDAPSGTALALADGINEAMDDAFHYVFDRSQTREKRDQKEIGLHALRGGTIVGEHSVIFAGRDEVLELKHEAHSKEVFAVGALNAALFLATQSPGFYTMKDVIASK